jgi:BASS family bile acid:Na+ symporter
MAGMMDRAMAMQVLLVLIKLSVLALIVAIGMRSTREHALYLLKRPGLLWRSVLAMYGLVPLAVFVLVKLLPLKPATEAALLVLAVSAGAPLLPRKLRLEGDDGYIVSLVMVSSVLAVALVPLWVFLLDAQFGVASEIRLTTVALLLVKAFLAPLLAGMLIRAFAPRLAMRLADPVLAGASAVLVGTALLLILANWRLLADVRLSGLAALAAVMIVALAIGHAMGGPDPRHRTVLAVSCATRHVGIALLVATAFPGAATLTLVMAYVLTATAVTLPYLVWRRRAGAGAA